MPTTKIEITKHWSDPSEAVGYAEGELLRSKWLALQFSSFCAYSAPLRGYSLVFYPAALVVMAARRAGDAHRGAAQRLLRR